MPESLPHNHASECPEKYPAVAPVIPIRPGAGPKPPRKAPRKAARKRGKAHPGVAILSPAGGHGWRLKYRDPISGRVKRPAVPPDSVGSVDAREAYAVYVWGQLQEVIALQRSGRSTPADVRIEDALTQWLASENWAPATKRLYKSAGNALAQYVGPARLVRDITPLLLANFRLAARSARPRLRGRRNATGVRELVSVNHELRMVGSFLRWARLGAGCTLSRDEIAELCKAFRTRHERKAFLETAALRRLLELTRKHEAQCFPAIVCLLLTGVRRAELAQLDWSWVDDGDRIRMPAAATKTAHVRDVDLTVAPEALPPRTAAAGPIFPATADQVRYAFERLRQRDPALAHVSAHALRRTCATYFTNAFNPWRSAKSLGHSVMIAERYYAGLVRVPTGCTTLAQAMGIEDLLLPPAAKVRKPRYDRGTTR
jgi:integrase